MQIRKTIGQIGEDIACLYLEDKKYRILARNMRIPAGELDVLARDPKGVLVFVEVKALAGVGEAFLPEQHFDQEKQWRVRRLAQNIANRYPHYIDEKLGYRIDLVAISIKDPLEKDWRKACIINHYENF